MLRGRAILGVGIDHDDACVTGAEIARHLAAYASVAADDEVVCVGIDHLLDAALFQEAAELPGDEELGNRRQAVEERTYPEELEDREDYSTGIVVGSLQGADGRDLVQRPCAAVGDRGVLGHRERDRAADRDGDQCSEQPRESAGEVALCHGTNDPPVGQRAGPGRGGPAGPPRHHHAINGGRARRPGSCARGRSAPAARRERADGEG